MKSYKVWFTFISVEFLFKKNKIFINLQKKAVESFLMKGRDGQLGLIGEGSLTENNKGKA